MSVSELSAGLPAGTPLRRAHVRRLAGTCTRSSNSATPQLTSAAMMVRMGAYGTTGAEMFGFCGDFMEGRKAGLFLVHGPEDS